MADPIDVIANFVGVGFAHDDWWALGLVGKVDWSGLPSRVQGGEAFGVDGVSCIEGGFSKRSFKFPFMVWNYSTPGQRDYAMMQMELKQGGVGAFKANTAAYTIISLPDVRFAELVPGRSGYDPIHLFWREMFLTFEQLSPIPADNNGQGNGGGTFGNGAGGP